MATAPEGATRVISAGTLTCRPALSVKVTVSPVSGAFFASLGQAILPGLNRAESKMVRTARELRYTKYKKAVLRKLENQPKKGDEKLLEKLNRTEFVLAYETYDPDEFTEKLYEEYMKNR